MEIPTQHLILAIEVFITTLGLLVALIYFHIRSDRQWQQLIHRMQDRLLHFRTRYLQEKGRADIIRALLHDKNSALEAAGRTQEADLATITGLREEIEKLQQSEKLRSEIANQLITSKMQVERFTAELAEQQRLTEALQETITTLEQEARMPEEPQQPETAANAPQQHNLQTEGAMALERLQARADKQEETIRRLERERMQAGHQKPAGETAGEETESRDLAQMLKESETCVELLESELATLQERLNQLEQEGAAQNGPDIQRLEQMLRESESCNQQLEAELDALQQKVRQLEGRETPPTGPARDYEI